MAFETVPITVQFNGYSTRLLLSCLLFICIIVQIYNCIFITLLIWPIAFRHNSSPMFTFSACVSAFFVSGLKFSRFSPPLISLPALVSLMIMIGYNIGIACTKFHGCGCILAHWKRAGLSRACDGRLMFVAFWRKWDPNISANHRSIQHYVRVFGNLLRIGARRAIFSTFPVDSP